MVITGFLTAFDHRLVRFETARVSAHIHLVEILSIIACGSDAVVQFIVFVLVEIL